MSIKNKGLITILIIVLVLIVDQASKIWVKTNMSLYETIEITSWLKIYFVENNGMAFGLEVVGKLFLSIFRIVAIIFIGYYLYTVIRNNYSTGFVATVALIWAGAFGNIIDSVFYGEIFSASYRGHTAQFVSLGEGYASWLHGKVVDMLYMPLFEGTFPTWMPMWGGEHFIFFSPIFNVADSAITVGILVFLICYRKTFNQSLEKKKEIEA